MKNIKRGVTKLQSIGPDALERLRDLVSMAPLVSTDRTTAADTELQRAGWIVITDEEGEKVAEMTPEAYRPDGRSCLYDDRGMVHSCWLKE